MATRIQGLRFGLGKAKQADFITASASFLRLRKLDTDPTSAIINFEDDAGEIGKGDEFAGQVFPVAKDFRTNIEKYASAEFTTWAWAYALGGVTELTGTYTLIPIDVATTIQGPVFSVVAQLDEGGGSAIDNLYYACAVSSVRMAFTYGPGRQSSKCTVGIVGSGKVLSPSAVVLPALTSEHHLASASMVVTINGVDYVAAKTLLSVNLGWDNSLLEAPGYFPGSGVQDGAAIRGRLESGNRAASFDFEARLGTASLEYTKLKAQTSGPAVITLSFDSTHTVTWTYAAVQYKAVTNSEADGIATVKVMVSPISNGTDPVVSVSAKCGITGIAQ